MTAAFVADRTELERVPDGTVISWLRIPGDHTSEAVAFVRREIDHDDQIGPPRQVTWISPGGWDPMSIEQAGVTFPATVIRWGEVPISEPEILPQVFSIESGGTWSRQAALDAAARVFTGSGPRPVIGEQVLDTAEMFQEWLTRPAPDAATLPERLRAGADAIDEAREILGPNGLHFGQMMLDLNDGRMPPPDTAQGFTP